MENPSVESSPVNMIELVQYRPSSHQKTDIAMLSGVTVLLEVEDYLVSPEKARYYDARTELGLRKTEKAPGQPWVTGQWYTIPSPYVSRARRCYDAKTVR